MAQRPVAAERLIGRPDRRRECAVPLVDARRRVSTRRVPREQERRAVGRDRVPIREGLGHSHLKGVVVRAPDGDPPVGRPGARHQRFADGQGEAVAGRRGIESRSCGRSASAGRRACTGSRATAWSARPSRNDDWFPRSRSAHTFPDRTSEASSVPHTLRPTRHRRPSCRRDRPRSFPRCLSCRRGRPRRPCRPCLSCRRGRPSRWFRSRRRCRRRRFPRGAPRRSAGRGSPPPRLPP